MKNSGLVRIMLFFVLMLGVCASVFATPGVPHQFYGSVTSNGNAVADDLMITVKIGSTEVAATVTKDSAYGKSPDIFYVQDPNNNRAGKNLEFYVNGIKATGYTFSNGASTRLNLDVAGLPVPLSCGDGSCNNGETCSTCSSDCGSCSTGGSPIFAKGSGGGGSPVFAKGGIVITTTTTTLAGQQTTPEDTTAGATNLDTSVIPTACIADWTCSGWLDCINGQQKRICVDSNRCGDDSTRPLETQTCLTAEEAKERGLNGITGWATATFGKTTLTVSLIVVVLAAIAVMIFILRKRK
jgi:hypothetical protein